MDASRVDAPLLREPLELERGEHAIVGVRRVETLDRRTGQAAAANRGEVDELLASTPSSERLARRMPGALHEQDLVSTPCQDRRCEQVGVQIPG